MSSLTQHRGAVIGGKREISVSFVGVNFDDTSPVTISRPSGTLAGDLLDLWVWGTISGGTPAGWTFVDDQSSEGWAYYWRIATGNSSDDVSLTGANAGMMSGIRAIGAATRVFGDIDVSTSSPQPIPSATAVGAGLEVLYGYAYQTAGSGAPSLGSVPAGFTRITPGTDTGIALGPGGIIAAKFIVYTRPVAAAGAVGTTNFSFSGISTPSGGGHKLLLSA